MNVMDSGVRQPRRRRRHGLPAGAALLATLAIAFADGCATAPASRPNGQLRRVEALALLQTLNADLLSHDSATLTLERWCAAHRLADPARIVVRRVRDADKPIPEELRAKLGNGAGQPRYRHVQLLCGKHVLSEADNWYVPGALTPEMNARLDTTDEPFGKVVAPLDFRRRTLSAQLLWSPLADGWEMSAARSPDPGPMRMPRDLLRHEAVLYASTQGPFSVVVETYTNQLFDFGDWPPLLARP